MANDHAQASDLSRELQLSLSNGEWYRLVRYLETSGSGEAARLFAGGQPAVLQAIGGPSILYEPKVPISDPYRKVG